MPKRISFALTPCAVDASATGRAASTGVPVVLTGTCQAAPAALIGGDDAGDPPTIGKVDSAAPLAMGPDCGWSLIAGASVSALLDGEAPIKATPRPRAIIPAMAGKHLWAADRR